MRVAIPRFPGSNCDQDALWALREDVGVAADYVWHDDHSLAGFDAVFIPGGFSFGDYLRCGAMAGRSPIMDEVARFASEGRPVLGVCNGFQVLCETGLLPGALLLNQSEKFVCRRVHLAAVNRTSLWTAGVDRVLGIPVAHGEGRYVCDEATLKRLQDEDRIAFRYVGPRGESGREHNPNGSVDAIAGVLNARGNVLGLMPHPERATKARLGSTDGLAILRAFAAVGVGG
ncbi:MAG: phosphoribosylformylglycinamidine synthase subunit PurQ [Fimbriimonadaceae bacterium]|nr:phosphoribosylformylglycinamidine synthase subunit PurQ [Fimbriimonadaceae bacterium]